jgi:biopolymer transport protein ExbB/TolQ
MHHIETLLHELSRWFLTPVLALIVLLFLYALYTAGGFCVEFLQRRHADGARPLHRLRERQPGCELADLELHVIRELEGLRLATRTAPLLGLVATMIPLGPALAGVASGQMQTVGQQVGVAFAAVIVALLAASICYAILIVRRRWRLGELRVIEKSLVAKGA